MTKGWSGGLFLRVLALLLLPSALVATDVCGSYSTSQTWDTNGSPYIVTCDVTISGTGGPVLTIAAGVTVKFNDGKTLIIGGSAAGGINVQGTSTQHVTFTSSSPSPAPGKWNGIQLSPSPLSTLSVTYADVFYSTNGVTYNAAGSPTISNLKVQNASGTGLTIDTGSPVISGATLTNNQWGLYVIAGSPTINSSTSVSSNSAGGIKIDSPATPSLQSVSVQSNTGYGISIDGRVTLGTVSSVTISGNGNSDAVELRTSATINANVTWKNLGKPYVASATVSVAGSATPVLTIPGAVTVKFPSGTELDIGNGAAGKISTTGTASSPVVLTSSLASPAAGSWNGLRFYPQASTGSTVSFTSIKYGGSNGWHLGGVTVSAGNPTLDHDTFDTNAYAGVTTSGSSAVISNCNFLNNSAGLLNQTPATPVTATFNWWNSNTGPSGSGPGTGQSVSSGATYEPWLGSAGSSPQYFRTFSLGNSTFNPNLSINANFSFTTAQSGNWSLKIYTAPNGTLIRTITGTGTSGAPAWDGKNDGGTLQANGTYTYQIDSAAGSNSAAPLRGRVTLDTTRQLTVSNLSLSPSYFSPNADGVQDTTTLSGTASFDGASWTLAIKNSGGTVVRSASGSATPNFSYTWDGKNGSGTIQPDGVYTFAITVTDGSASVPNTPTVTLDRTAPVSTIASPAAGVTVSDVYQNGSSNVTVTGTSTDANLSGWTLDYGAGASPTTWTNIATGTTGVSNGTLGTWSTLALTNGQYTLRLVTTDLAGNKTTATNTLTVGNFNVTGGSQTLNPTQSGTATFHSIVPFTVTETLVIKNSGGQTVRTLFSGSRNAGTFNDVWDGKNAQNSYVPAGTYTAVATVTAGSYNMTWNPPLPTIDDNTPMVLNTFHWTWTSGTHFWPFNNSPLPLTYTIPVFNPPAPVRTWILFTPDALSVYFNNEAKVSMCSLPGNFCMPAGIHQGIGTYTVPWLGLDPNRVLRPDIQAIVVMSIADASDGNVVHVTGSEPAVTGLVANPSYFRPGFGNLQFSMNVGTFQNSQFSVTAIFERIDVAGPLKTISLVNQPAGGLSFQWDGRSDSGFLLAEGNYLVTITITDALGSVTTQQSLIAIGY